MKIGFKNFKKFADFPPIELSPITFIVGPNNSGKSSFITALMLLLTNLKNRFSFVEEDEDIAPIPLKYITFWNKSNSNYGWGDFTTSLNSETGNNYMVFSYEDGEGEMTITLGNDFINRETAVTNFITVPVQEFRYKNKDVTVIYKCCLAQEGLNAPYKISGEAVQYHKTYGITVSYLKRIIEAFNSPDNDESSLRLYYIDLILERLSLSSEEKKEVFEELRKNIQQNPDRKEFFVEGFDPSTSSRLEQGIFACCEGMMFDSFIGGGLYFPQICYVETHNATHQMSISTSDKNNYLGQTILEYVTEVSQKIYNYEEYEVIKKWICKWLKKFKIGDDFNIEIKDGGENAIVRIYNSDQSRMLGTLGTGSIQMFILLLKIGIAMKTDLALTRVEGYAPYPQLILVEEPEQNLHPALQSLLADMFKEAWKLSGHMINFIVETHSEYLIRKTQVMVAKENYPSEEDLQKNNPFRVYYFPEKGLPYDMRYMVNGRFAEKFGSGFFDEASNLAFEIF